MVETRWVHTSETECYARDPKQQHLLECDDINPHLNAMQGNVIASSSHVQEFCNKQIGTRCNILQSKVATLCLPPWSNSHACTRVLSSAGYTHPPTVQAITHLSKCYSHVVSQKSSNWLIITATPVNPSHHNSFFLSKAENSKVPAAGHKPSKYNNKE